LCRTIRGKDEKKSKSNQIWASNEVTTANKTLVAKDEENGWRPGQTIYEATLERKQTRRLNECEFRFVVVRDTCVRVSTSFSRSLLEKLSIARLFSFTLFLLIKDLIRSIGSALEAVI
jgi:hypothetical protein